jgi:toxin ParE1/3/4
VIQYIASALVDIEHAARWYEGRQEGLGDNFIADVREAAKRIEANPKGYRKVIGEARKVALKRFPYAMYFKIEPDGSLVFAYLHASRRPELAGKGLLAWIPIRPPEP